MRNQYFMTKVCSFIAAIFLMANTAQAASYTAIASGKFSSTASWAGGLIPPSILSTDDITIPSGINITLDQNLTLSTASSLDVNGILSGGNGYVLVMNGGILNGGGSIDIDSFSADFTSGFNFTGGLRTNAFYTTNATINTTANIVIDNTLYLAGGTMTMANGMLDFSQNATIVVDGGMMLVTGGTADLTSTYHVMYKGGASTAGIELSGTGLTNITINTTGTNEVKLSNDLTVNGMLMLNSGTLNLNNNDLTIGAGGDVSASGSGNIRGNSNSSIIINASNGLAGSLRFSSGGNTIDDLRINLGNNNAMVMIDGDLMIDGELNMQSGRIDIGDNKLEVRSTGVFTGGSANSYVVTGTGGRLSLNLNTGGSQWFHVGTSNNYAPAMIKLNSGASGMMSVGVNSDVMAQGTSGTTIDATQPVVDATWFIENSTTASVNADVELMWSAAMEVNNFNRSKAYISHYMNGSWDMTATAAATMSGGMYSITRTGITSFSPFAVFDENTAVSVDEIAANSDMNIYPNPATDRLNISFGKQLDAPATAEVYSVSGRLVQSAAISGSNSTLDVSALNSGVYYIRIAGEEVNATQKFVKQ